MLQNIQSQQLMHHTSASLAAMQQSLPGVLPSQSLPSVAQTVPTMTMSTANQTSTDAVYLYPSMQLPLGTHYDDWSKVLYRTAADPVLQQMHHMQGIPTEADWAGAKLIYRENPVQTQSPVPNSIPGYPYLTQAPGGNANPNLVQEMNLQGQLMHPGTALPIMPNAKNKNDKLEVCREFQRGNCSRGEQECKFAHPNEQTTIDNTDNTVTVCMDYIKGRCTREKCKYFHPPPHLQAKIKAAQHQANQASVVPGVFPGFVPPTKKPPTMAGSPTILNHHHHHHPASAGLYHQIQMQLANAGHQQPSYIPTQGIERTILGGLPAGYSWPQGKLGNSFLCPGDLMSQMSPALAIPMMQPMPGTPASVPLHYTHQFVQSQQSADTIPVCRDFKSGSCKRPNCKYAHVTEDYVEIIDGKVTLCRYAAQSRCTRPKCKFYHPPTSSMPLMTTVPLGSMPTTPVVTSV